MLVAVNYHYVRPDFAAPFPAIHGVTPDGMENQLERLGALGTFVSGAEVAAAVRGETALPERALLVTFDDGLAEQFEHAWPRLRRLGVPALFFVNSAPLAGRTVSTVHKIHLLRSQMAPDRLLERLRAHGAPWPAEADAARLTAQYPYDPPGAARLKYLLNFQLPAERRDALVGACFEEVFPGEEAGISSRLYMDRGQLAELAAQGALGTHGERHLPLAALPPKDAGTQIRRSLDALRAWTGARPIALSYPYGGRESCSAAVARAAGRCGIEFAFTMERAVNRDLARPRLLARFDCNDLPGGKRPLAGGADPFAALPGAAWFSRETGT